LLRDFDQLPAKDNIRLQFNLRKSCLGGKFQDEIHMFDKMRSKRHRVVYDVSGLVSQAEARQALDFAVRYVEMVEKILAK
jgi:uncharacterized protein (UPF0332 family)